MLLEQSQIESFKKIRPDPSSGIVCHAPFKSIFFGTQGNLFTCCFNRIYILGNYPRQTIKEIWFGAKTDELRKTIKQNDFSLGCQVCGRMLAAKNFEGLPIKNFDYVGWDEAGYPTKIDFELDNTCNLECIMCRGEHSSSIRQNREKKPPLISPYDKEFLRQLEEFIPHLQSCHFLGGEPFLIPIYLEVWEKMIELNPKISISVQTNATIMNERIKRILDAMPFSIAISIDSIEKDAYERIRVNARFERVMENIQYFKHYCERNGKKLTISYCPMIQNWEELPRVVEFCNDLNADVFFNTVTLPVHCSLSYLSASELREIVAHLQHHPLPEETEVQRFNKKALTSVINQVKYWSEQALSRERIVGGQKTTSILELYTKLDMFVENLQNSETDKQKIFSEVSEKIDYLLLCADKEGLLEKAKEYLCSIDPILILDYFPTMDKENLYESLKNHAGL